MKELFSSFCFFFSSRRRHTRWPRDWSSDVCSSDLDCIVRLAGLAFHGAARQFHFALLDESDNGSMTAYTSHRSGAKAEQASCHAWHGAAPVGGAARFLRSGNCCKKKTRAENDR